MLNFLREMNGRWEIKQATETTYKQVTWVQSRIRIWHRNINAQKNEIRKRFDIAKKKLMGYIPSLKIKKNV